MEQFIQHISELFEETDSSLIKADTAFKELDEWSSLMALSIIAMIDEEYGVTIGANAMKDANTIEELYKEVMALK